MLVSIIVRDPRLAIARVRHDFVRHEPNRLNSRIRVDHVAEGTLILEVAVIATFEFFNLVVDRPSRIDELVAGAKRTIGQTRLHLELELERLVVAHELLATYHAFTDRHERRIFQKRDERLRHVRAERVDAFVGPLTHVSNALATLNAQFCRRGTQT